MSEKLREYRKKRDFDKTAEPSGKSADNRSGADRKRKFVVQRHEASRDHYDFRLEWRGVLLSWAVPKGPSFNPEEKRLAVRVEDHPLDYAGFEGVIPKGQYGGGTVMLWDEGEWEPQTDFGKGLREGSLKIVLHGSRLKGKWALVRLKEKDGERDNWLLIKEKDEFAKRTTGVSRFRKSVRTDRTMAQIAAEEGAGKKNPFDRAQVQLAKLVDEVPSEGDWLYEIKYDGYRILAFSEGGRVRLFSRNGHDYTENFPSVAESIRTWADGRAMVLDGEMVVNDDQGRSDFQALQRYLKKTDDRAPTYAVFDLLAFDGADLRGFALSERKDRLEKLMKGAPPDLLYSKHVEGRGKEFFAEAAKLKLEGVVGKRASSVYSGDRSGDWIKIKSYRRQEFVIGGYTRSQKKDSGLSALLLGVYEKGKLIYAGRAGTGIGLRDGEELVKKFERIRKKNAPFDPPPKIGRGETVVWLSPRTVAEVQFAEWTKEDVLRQASFKGIRTDKEPEDVVREDRTRSGGSAQSKTKTETKGMTKNKKGKAASASAQKKTRAAKPRQKAAEEAQEVCGVTISNPERTIFPDVGVSKIDVARYYERVAPRMLKYVRGRVLSVVRCHQGVEGECFFKKHPSAVPDGVKTVTIANTSGEKSDYFYIENERGLIGETQLGSLEYHVWGSRAKKLEKPDLMVFDLDPDEGMDLAQVRQGVRDLKNVLDRLALRSFLKTSGGKGYHVVVPFEPSADWDAFHDFARGVAELMESRWPDLYTCNIRKIKRKGKIFIDWARNGRGSTSVAPYSLRARPGARVSMPIFWKELDAVAPDGIDMEEALKRIAKTDPWRDFEKVDQRLTPGVTLPTFGESATTFRAHAR